MLVITRHSFFIISCVYSLINNTSCGKGIYIRSRHKTHSAPTRLSGEVDELYSSTDLKAAGGL